MSDCQPVQSIAAVVVTYNRLGLLKRCIETLRGQTRRLNQIIIVNNGSTDGTAEWVASQSDLTLVTQPNLGGAGGQASGIRIAYDAGHDRIWCMDDDGEATPMALSNLLAHAGVEEPEWLNSLVVDTKDQSKLAFPLVTENTIVHSVAEATNLGLILPGANPFNGTLLNRLLLEKVGYPHPDLFIWGDEAEYYRRSLSACARIATVTDSVFLHPPASTMTITEIPVKSFFKYYYFVRNYQASVDESGRLTFSPWCARQLGLKLIRSLGPELTRRPYSSLAKSWIILHAIWAAWCNDITRRYL